MYKRCHTTFHYFNASLDHNPQPCVTMVLMYRDMQCYTHKNVVCDCNMQWYRNISVIFSMCVCVCVCVKADVCPLLTGYPHS